MGRTCRRKNSDTVCVCRNKLVLFPLKRDQIRRFPDLHCFLAMQVLFHLGYTPTPVLPFLG